MTIDEQLAWWMVDPGGIPSGACWGPNEATFAQMVIAWTLMDAKLRGQRMDARWLGYHAAGLLALSPGTAHGWTNEIERIAAAREASS